MCFPRERGLKDFIRAFSHSSPVFPALAGVEGIKALRAIEVSGVPRVSEG